MGLSATSQFRAKDEIRTRDPDLGRVVLYQLSYFRIGAIDEVRTHDLHLGKVALYQLSYYRIILIFLNHTPK